MSATYLTYADQPPRTETEATVVATLIRKGWVVTEPPVEPEPPAPNFIALGEAHVEQSGFSAARLVTLFDLRLQCKEAGTVAQHPKLVAIYGWRQTVKATALAGSNQFPAAPYTFEEVIAE